jgi:hypothetical membrane protein
MTLKNWKDFAYTFVIIGCVQYIVFLFVAMLFYAGGTANDPSVQGYTFWGNYISDLGRTKAHSGKSNTISMIIFTITEIILGVSLIPFFLALPSLFEEIKQEKILGTIGSFFGVIFSICLIGIAFTPVDIMFRPHMIFVIVGYISLFFMGILYTTTMFLNKDLPKQFAYIFLFFTVIYVISLTFAIVVGITTYSPILVLGQKIGRITTLICCIFVAYGAKNIETS